MFSEWGMNRDGHECYLKGNLCGVRLVVIGIVALVLCIIAALSSTLLLLSSSVLSPLSSSPLLAFSFFALSALKEGKLMNGCVHRWSRLRSSSDR